MKQFIGILLFAAILSGLSSCYSTSIEKPDKLIKKDKFMKMMVDIYLVQGYNIDQRIDTIHKKLTQNRSVLFSSKEVQCPPTPYLSVR